VRLVLVMVRDESIAPAAGGRHGQHSIVLVPLDTPGLSVERNIPVMDHQALEGHCELVFRNVRVPKACCWGIPGRVLRWPRHAWDRPCPPCDAQHRAM
jgi:acyl-CoA dehydrogenase